MRVKIILDDGTQKYAQNATKRKIVGILTNLSNKSAIIKGTCRIDYGHGDYNEFEFDSEQDFIFKLGPCVERQLLGEYA